MRRIFSSGLFSERDGQIAVVVIAIVLFVAFNDSAKAQGTAKLHKYEIPNARLVFLDKNTSYLVPHTIRSFENALRFHRQFWQYAPSGVTNILFNDFSDVGNGGTMVLPWNFLSIGVSPFDYTFSVVPTNERMQWLMNHELTHQVMCDQASRSDQAFRSIFGGKVVVDNRDPLSMVYSYFTTPRWYSPRWYHEGIAVFMETWMSGGIGRVLGGYDEMVFRTMVHDSAYFYNVIGLEAEGTTIDFQVGVNAYLYGTRFVSYLAYQYGTGPLRDFYARTDSSRRFYASQFKKIYGIPVQDAWNQWIQFEHEFQRENLNEIRRNPVTAYRKISEKPIGSGSRQFYDQATNKIIAAVNYPGRLAHIAEIDAATGEMKRIAPVPSPGLYYVTSLAYDEAGKKIFVSTHNTDWRGLQSIDLQTGRTKKLIRYTRCGNLVFDPAGRALWGIQSMSGRSCLLRFNEPYTEYQTILTLPYGQEMTDPAISPDGSLLSATLSDVTGRQRLVIYNIPDLLAGKQDYRELYEFEDNAASNFVFSPDGRYLYGTSFYTGVSNVFRIPVIDGTAQILTNAETGFFRPLPVSEDSMIVFNYTHRGMVAGMVKIDTLADVNAIRYLGQMVYDRNPDVGDWVLPPPSVIDLDSLHVVEDRYHPLKEIRFAGAYPIIQGYKNYVAPGYRVNFMDPMGLNSFIFKFSVSPYKSLPLKQIFHLSAEYSFWNWTFTANYNYADFYDLFGPTKFSRAGYSFSGKYYKLINRMSPTRTDFSIKISAYGDLEQLPYYQNVSSDIRNLFVAAINFHKSYLRKSLGAIEPEQGYEWNVYALTSLAKETFYPQLINNFDFGFLLPMRNSSLWFRTSVGQSLGEPDKSNSYFYFGGFGNNYVDYRAAQQYRDMYSFPGKEINELSALNYGKLSAEVNLTPIRFRKLGFKSLYITYCRFTVFGMGLFTNLANEEPQGNFYSSGVQTDIEIVLFSLLKSTLSFGYARAYGSDRPGDQFMVSLKL